MLAKIKESLPTLLATCLGTLLFYQLLYPNYLEFTQDIAKNNLKAISQPLIEQLGPLMVKQKRGEIFEKVYALKQKNAFLKTVSIKDHNNAIIFKSTFKSTEIDKNSQVALTQTIHYRHKIIGTIKISSNIHQQFPMLKTYFFSLCLCLAAFFAFVSALYLITLRKKTQKSITTLIACTRNIITGDFIKKELSPSQGLVNELEENLLSLNRFMQDRNNILQKVSQSKDIVVKMQDAFINKKDIQQIIKNSFPEILKITDSDYALICIVDYADNEATTMYNLINSDSHWWREISHEILEPSTLSNIQFKKDSPLKSVLTTHMLKKCLIKTSNYQQYLLATPIFSGRKIQGILLLARENKDYEDKTPIEHEVFIHSLGQILLAFKNQRKLITSYSEIKTLAEHDRLTGLYNRNYFEKLIKQSIHKAKKNHALFALLLVDIIEFKKINDFYGHKTGDEILIMISQRLKANLKNGDSISRLGSDEFAIILDKIESIELAKKVVWRLIEKITHENYTVSEKNIQCSISVGIAIYPHSGKNIEELITHASFALSEAKENPEKWGFYGDELASKHLAKIELEKDIINALKSEHLFCVFQPQINMFDGSIYGFESLLRWAHPKNGFIQPSIFIPIIEKNGLSKITNEYVLRYVLKTIERFKHNGSCLEVSINISPCVERFDRHISSLMSIYKQYDIPKNVEIAFEITESGFLDNSNKTMDEFKTAITILKEHNIKLAIDDFGIEQSSLIRFAQYQFDILKIDKVFIDNIATKEKNTSKVIVKAITLMAKELNIDIIAEGVETLEQVEKLKNLNIKIAQGFYYHKPLRQNDVIALLKGN